MEDEATTPDEADTDLVASAIHRGLLAAGTEGESDSAHAQHARLEWFARTPDVPLRIFLQLRLRLPDTATAADFWSSIARASRPRRPTDVASWLADVGAARAEWRVEIEVVPPFSTTTVSQALYLHHLIYQITTHEPPMSRIAFVQLFEQNMHDDKASAARAFARSVLLNLCTRHRIPFCTTSGYPLQHRPHDLVPRDVDRLVACAATPKADGREAFLVGHAFGWAIVARAGDVHAFAWTGAPLFPLLLEGELVTTGDQILFIAYDCVVTPVTAYARHGRLETRYAAVRAIVRRLGLSTVRWKPFFVVEPHPHRALESCLAWSSSTGIPCDGVIFADASQSAVCVTHRQLRETRVLGSASAIVEGEACAHDRLLGTASPCGSQCLRTDAAGRARVCTECASFSEHP